MISKMLSHQRRVATNRRHLQHTTSILDCTLSDKQKNRESFLLILKLLYFADPHSHINIPFIYSDTNSDILAYVFP